VPALARAHRCGALEVLLALLGELALMQKLLLDLSEALPHLHR
jgi:hypothetical protein